MSPTARLLGALAAGVCAASAGVIHGIVVEHASGRPLARARVKLEVFSGSKLELVSTVLANRSGQFTFLSLPDGHYLLSAWRAAYHVATYGQKHPTAPGTPIMVSSDSVTFSEMRLQKLAAITGRVFDENRVGLPGITVLAYPAVLPLRMTASEKTDDRGIYRIAGLAPGRYYIRTAAHDLEDGAGLLPTFFPESAGTKEAVVLRGELDRDASEIDVQPLPGKLSRLSGRITGCTGLALVTLSSDTGRKHTTAPCLGEYAFDGLAPAYYELLAEVARPEGAPPASLLALPSVAAFQDLFLDRDKEGQTLQLVPTPSVTVRFQAKDRSPIRPSEVTLLARRKDLAGEAESLRIARETASLSPGFWEMTAAPPPGYYLASISNAFDRRRASRAGQNPDWYELYLGPGERVWLIVELSPRPSNLSGRITSSGGDPVPGAPVFLYPTTPETRKRLNGAKTARADAQGRYRFEGLPPGGYLLLSSLDLDEVTEESLSAARARTLTLEEGQSATQDLVLYVSP